MTTTATTISTVDGASVPPALLVEPIRRRGRLSVAFRLLLVLPQAVALYVLSLVGVVVVLLGWLAALVLGRLPAPFARYLAHLTSYATRVNAYLWLLTDRYPPFRLSADDYPVRVELAPGRLNRLAVLFRLLLAIPAAILSTLATGGWLVSSFVIWLRCQRSWLVMEPLPGYAPERNLVEALWSNLKGVELANLAGDTLEEVIAATERGIQRSRHTHHLAYAFLRHSGLSLW
jgi:Domain of unknown function (DUF4389)